MSFPGEDRARRFRSSAIRTPALRELVEELLGLRSPEELDDRLGDDAPTPSTSSRSSTSSFGDARRCDPNDRRCRAPSSIADVADTQSVEQPIDRPILRALDRIEEVVDRLVLVEWELRDVFFGEREDVGNDR